MKQKSKAVVDYYDAVAKTYHKKYDRNLLYSLHKYPNNYFRLQHLITSFTNQGINRVIEVGVGEGTPLATLAKAGMDVWGFDISLKMVQMSKKKAKEAGIDPEHIFLADIQDPITYPQALKGGQFDGLMAMGVMPHITNDKMVLENMASLVRSGGVVFIEFRNLIFSLFTFNRYTHDFIVNDLLSGVDEKIRRAVSAELKSMLKMDRPARRSVNDDDRADYDAILSKFHNPFEMQELFDSSGFDNIKFHWYHYHPAPPFMEGKLPTDFRKGGIGLEHESSGWKGIFLCSAFVVEARKE